MILEMADIRIRTGNRSPSTRPSAAAWRPWSRRRPAFVATRSTVASNLRIDTCWWSSGIRSRTIRSTSAMPWSAHISPCHADRAFHAGREVARAL